MYESVRVQGDIEKESEREGVREENPRNSSSRKIYLRNIPYQDLGV
jgi:hypothetical protein